MRTSSKPLEISDSVFNALEWRTASLHIDYIEELVKGSLVVGIEQIEAIPEGLLFYFKGRDGKGRERFVILETGDDSTRPLDEFTGNGFYARYAVYYPK